MFEYELATLRRADLLREAEAYRLARAASKAHRVPTRSQEPEGTVREGRSRFTRAA
ncbi:hypothetical protein AB0F11_00635 [Streptomyces sp. NPDC032472]|uniref:hypothetical protein n=1 Tax=Streptomyces sp. NPDC032472 TaxID=3155018 RepID=UPI003403D63E